MGGSSWTRKEINFRAFLSARHASTDRWRSRSRADSGYADTIMLQPATVESGTFERSYLQGDGSRVYFSRSEPRLDAGQVWPPIDRASQKPATGLLLHGTTTPRCATKLHWSWATGDGTWVGDLLCQCSAGVPDQSCVRRANPSMLVQTIATLRVATIEP